MVFRIYAMGALLAAVSAAQCTLDPAEFNQTSFTPVLALGKTGFNTLDTLHIWFDNPNKYELLTASAGVPDHLQALHGRGVSPEAVNGFPAVCYTRYELVVAWEDMIDSLAVYRTDADPDWIIFTAKVNISNSQPLGNDGRDNFRNRTVVSTLPFQLRFPKRVSAEISFSVFDDPLLQSRILEQSVDVEVVDLSATGRAVFATSLQWPFKLTPQANQVDPENATHVFHGPTVAVLTAGVATATWTLVEDCADRGGAASSPGPSVCKDLVSQAAPAECSCLQKWQVDILPLAGVCELDAEYQLVFEPRCQSSFTTRGWDCPLRADGVGSHDNRVALGFTLDSEFFCEQVADTITAEVLIQTFRDFEHQVPAYNFVLGSTIYFTAKLTSTRNVASVLSTMVDDLELVLGNTTTQPFQHAMTDKVDAGLVSNLQVQNSGDAGNTQHAVVPDDEAWWSWTFDDPPFPVRGTDGASEFSVRITFDVLFLGAEPLPLLLLDAQQQQQHQVGASLLLQAGAQRLKALDSEGFFAIGAGAVAKTTSPDGETSGASRWVATAGAVVASAAAGALLR